MKLLEFMRDKKKKVFIYMIVLLGVLFLIIGSGDGTPEPEEAPALDATPNTEERLEQILEKIEGVGEADVMIVYRDNGRKIYATDVSVREGSRETQAVMQSGSGSSAPFVVQEKEPSVKGVIIVADGGENPAVQAKLKEATAAVLEVYAHNIAVYGRENYEE